MWKYKRTNVNGRYELEHRLVVEKFLGRKLKEKEVVHHIDENQENNSTENLIVFATQSDHRRFHNNGIMVKVSDYYVSPKKTLHKCFEDGCSNRCYSKFCSIACSAKCCRKIKNRPSKEELTKLLETKSYCELGRMFGVSDRAIRKWIK